MYLVNVAAIFYYFRLFFGVNFQILEDCKPDNTTRLIQEPEAFQQLKLNNHQLLLHKLFTDMER